MWHCMLAVGRRQGILRINISPAAATLSFPQQKRTVYSKYAVPDYAKEKPAPWPYKERGYMNYHMGIDFGVSKRLDENSKLIIVEGNIGVGKGNFAKDLAERLDFYHIPDPPLDDLFIDSYGDDRRLYYHLYPETCREFDTRMFYEQPRHRNVAWFQKRRFQCRFEAYLNALAHILNTGQGVVLERHYASDRVFVEAMYKKKYLSDAFRWHYYKFLCPNLREEIELFPHLIIYLDCPISKCLENIKKDHKPWEWQNEVMDYAYLEEIEKGLKGYLKEYSRHCEILNYDWTHGGDVNAVAEDVEKLDLDSVYLDSEKFESWHIVPNELYFVFMRHHITSDKWRFLQHFYTICPEVEELMTPTGDKQQQVQVHDMLFGKYGAGFKRDRGDSVLEMALSFMYRDETTNKHWSEYLIQDAHHSYGHDLMLNHPGTPLTPSFPEEYMLPRSPYKSDGGCMADAELFMDESGHLIHHGH